MSRDGSNCFLRDRGGDEEREGEGGRDRILPSDWLSSQDCLLLIHS